MINRSIIISGIKKSYLKVKPYATNVQRKFKVHIPSHLIENSNNTISLKLVIFCLFGVYMHNKSIIQHRLLIIQLFSLSASYNFCCFTNSTPLCSISAYVHACCRNHDNGN